MNSIGQFFLALLVGWCCYMTATFATFSSGTRSLAVQAFLGLIFTLFALLPVFVVGLPLRLIGPLDRLWRGHWWLALVPAALAIALMYASWLPMNRVQYFDTNLKQTLESPHPWLGLGGWFLAMFAAAHFHPPVRRSST